MYKVPFNDLRPSEMLAKELSDAFYSVMGSGKFILGDQVFLFESEFADYIGVDHCITVGNGFEALVIALRSVGADSDIIAVPTNAPLPTWMAVTQSGNRIHPVDPDEQTMLFSPTVARESVAALLPVHLYGAVADIEEMKRINPGVTIIEDCAQAHGSMLRGRMAGSLGDVAAWSFYPTKNLGCYGDGGAITTDNDEIAKVARNMREYGKGLMRGINSRLDEMQAAFLRVKLKYLYEENQLKVKRAKRYCDNLAEVASITLPEYNPQFCYHQFVIKVKDRNGLIENLNFAGIETKIHYAVFASQQSIYRSYWGSKIAERLSTTVLSLPIANATDDQIDYVCEQIIGYCNR